MSDAEPDDQLPWGLETLQNASSDRGKKRLAKDGPYCPAQLFIALGL